MNGYLNYPVHSRARCGAKGLLAQEASQGRDLSQVWRDLESAAASADGHGFLLLGPNDNESLLAFLACLAAGRMVIPLSPQLDRVAQEHYLGPLGVDLKGEIVLGSCRLTPFALSRDPFPADTRLGLLTSGSQGEPKLVLRSGESLREEGRRYLRSLKPRSRAQVLCPLPLCHAFALGVASGLSLESDCSVRVCEFNPMRVADQLLDHPPSIVVLVPATARLVCSALAMRLRRARGIDQAVVGAGPVTEGLEKEIIRWLGVRPCRNYGSSETGATLATRGEAVPEGTTGAPLPGVEASCSGSVTPSALFVRTESPFLGYWTPQGLDTSRLSPDGWYSTGDLASAEADGWIRVRGRLGPGLRIGSRWIQPAEVESALNSLPEVQSAAVIGRRDTEGEDLLEAHLEVRSGQSSDSRSVKAALRERLDEYKIPSRFLFHSFLPRGPSGKPDRQKLAGTQPGSSEPFLRAVTGHRILSLVRALHNTRVLEPLSRGLSSSEAADLLGLDSTVLETTLDILLREQVLERDLRGAIRPPAHLRALLRREWLDFERSLESRWTSCHAIEDVLRNGVGCRMFERSVGEDFISRYKDALAGPGRKAALLAQRACDARGPVLDWSCPAGCWRSRTNGVGEEPVRLEAPVRFGRPSQAPPRRLWGTVFLHNSLRRLAHSVNKPLLWATLSRMAEGSVLAISDLFSDAKPKLPWLNSLLRTDSLTHGSLDWQAFSDLRPELRKLKFSRFKRIASGPCFECIICLKGEAS